MFADVLEFYKCSPVICCGRQGQWLVWGYSGLTNEKSWNSSWSKLAISSWSGGVSSGGWRVKKRSKFSASRPHCHLGERERERGGGGGGEEDGVNLMRDVKKKRTTMWKKRNTTKTWHQPIKSVTVETVDFHWSKMKASDISVSVIGYYTHKCQFSICQSSEQW